MIKLNQIFAPLGEGNEWIERYICGLLKVGKADIDKWQIAKKSVDSRKKNDIKYVLSVDVELKKEKEFLKKHPQFVQNVAQQLPQSVEQLLALRKWDKKNARPVVVGSGPCGLFAALTLALAGARPIVVERGQSVEKRLETVEKFFKTGELDTNSNIQFGEGGAGTFSDGKLNTGIKSDKINAVLSEFVSCGANADIMYEAKPHIGTDVLLRVVKNMREKIVSLGGEFLFETHAVDLVEGGGKLQGLKVENVERGKFEIKTNACILAIGHSSRDTFEMLAKKIALEQKAFAIGVRIEHLQEDISFAQYGDASKKLPPADYKLACHLENGRSCFSFCMCPGGEVVAAASEEGGVVTNGMSMRARGGENANSAILVNVLPSDFGGDGVLAGVEFQRKYEELAYKMSGSYKAPTQRLGDFEKGKVSTGFGKVKPTYSCGTVFANLEECLPPFVSQTIKIAIKEFDKKIKGFACPDALLTGVETRTSSPVRIVRNDEGDSSIVGLMPAGEGAGYAGGIMSASVDGIVTALKLIGNSCIC